MFQNEECNADLKNFNSNNNNNKNNYLTSINNKINFDGNISNNNYYSHSPSGSCECDKHDEINVVTLSNELDKNTDLNKHMLNFNFNIITICPTPKLIFIDFLKDKIKGLVEYEERRLHQDFFNKKKIKSKEINTRKISGNEIQSILISSENNDQDPFISFYTDFVVYTLFNILKTFKAEYSTQYLHIKNVFYPEITPSNLVGVLKKTVSFKRLLDYDENLELYFKTKANFAFMIYYIYIKSHFLGNNNLLNLKSMLNLNIVQRILYIHQSKKFYRFALYSENLSRHFTHERNFKNFKYKKNEKHKGSKKNNFQKNIKSENNLLNNEINDKNDINDVDFELLVDPLDIPLLEFDKKLENWEHFIYELADEIINIIDLMLQVHDNQPIIKYVMCDVMLTLSKIMKFLIKYNLIDDCLKVKYFEIIQDTLVAFVNELDEGQQNYWDLVVKLVCDNDESEQFADFSHKEKIEFLEKSGKKDQAKKLDLIYLENENLKNNIWFVLPAIKCIFYYMLKKNDDLVIMKLKGKYSKAQSQEKYCFISNSESDMLSKIFLLGVKIFNENSYSTRNQESVYKKKILKFDLYVKKILELLNGNNEFYLKSLESIIHQFKLKLDALFIQDLGEQKNNPQAYVEFFKSKIFAENNFSNKHYNNLNMKVLTSEDDFHLEIIKGLNLEMFVKFNEINIDFGNMNKNFYEYDLDFREFANHANSIWERFRNFFIELDFNPQKMKTDLFMKNTVLLDEGSNKHVNNFVKNKFLSNKNYQYGKDEKENEDNDNNNFYYNKCENENKKKIFINQINEMNDNFNNNNLANNDNANDSYPKHNTSMNNGIQIMETYQNLKSDRQTNRENNYNNNKNNNKKHKRISKKFFSKNRIYSNLLSEPNKKRRFHMFTKFVSDKIKNSHIKSNSYEKLTDLKQLIGYTDFLENFNEFLDIYSRSKSFDSKLNAINIRYDLLKFILNMLYIISDDSNDNLVLIMTINPIKLVDAFFDYKEELCVLLCRLANVFSKFDYNDNYFF